MSSMPIQGDNTTISLPCLNKEYRLRQTGERIRNSFESRELDVLRWIPGKLNIADALTKRNVALYKVLNEVATTGKLLVDVDRGYELDSETWV